MPTAATVMIPSTEGWGDAPQHIGVCFIELQILKVEEVASIALCAGMIESVWVHTMLGGHGGGRFVAAVGLPARSFSGLLDHLATLTRNTLRVRTDAAGEFDLSDGQARP
jgi:hypothetical protein